MPRLALFAITGGVVVPPDEPLPEPVEPPEVPELPDPLPLPDPLVLPEPLVPPDPLDVPDPLVLPDPLDVPDPLDPPESAEPLVVDVDDCPALAPLLPPQAVIANAMQATSNPLRTNDVFMMKQCSSDQHRLRARVYAHEVQSTCHGKHKWSRATDVPVANCRPNAPNPEIHDENVRMIFSEWMLLMFPAPRRATTRRVRVTKVVTSMPKTATRDTRDPIPTSRLVTRGTPPFANWRQHGTLPSSRGPPRGLGCANRLPPTDGNPT
jgi:hypothetical protein